METHVLETVEPTSPSDGVRRLDRTTRNVSMASAGAVLVALQAVSCPLTVILLISGVGTTWIGGLSALDPYKPLFLALAVAQLGLGYYFVYGKSKRACAKGGAWARPSPNRIAKLSLWSATALVAIAIAFDYFALAIFDMF